jgi:hypothetical protein
LIKLIDKLADWSADKWFNQECESHDPGDAYLEGFKRGFRKAREMIDLQIWNDPEHTYCDFFYDGQKVLEQFAEEDIDEHRGRNPKSLFRMD